MYRPTYLFQCTVLVLSNLFQFIQNLLTISTTNYIRQLENISILGVLTHISECNFYKKFRFLIKSN